MLKNAFCLVILLSNFQTFSQQNQITTTFVRDFISTNNLTSGEPRLVRNWPIKDSAEVKKTFSQRLERFMEKANSDVQLTQDEKRYVIDKYINAYIQPWQQEDFKGTKFLEFDQLLPYLKLDENNTALLISHPVFLRNGDLFFVSYTNLCCGELMGSNAELFYRKVNGKWEKWTYVQ